jgi:hypothetical protein
MMLRLDTGEGGQSHLAELNLPMGKGHTTGTGGNEPRISVAIPLAWSSALCRWAFMPV